MTTTKHVYNWKRQKQDIRDFRFSQIEQVKKLKVTVAPPVTNLRRWCSEVENQKEIGSCTGNAWAGLMEYHENFVGRGGKSFQDLSRLFIYYNERLLEGTVNEDTGAEMRSGANALAKWGVCPEKDWPYITDRFTQKPATVCYKNATPHKITGYYSLRTFNDLKLSIANNLPFVFGFLVYESFESDVVANTGVMAMPNTRTERLLGGHAVMAVGYNDYEKRFLVRNSWGRNWGLKGTNAGYFTMPYDFIANPEMASDFWTVIRIAEDK